MHVEKLFGQHTETLVFVVVLFWKKKHVIKYVKVDWIDDHEFEMDRQRLIDLRGKDCRSDWRRIDKVKIFDKDKMIEKLSKL